jgi:hypothetical protein
MGPEWSNICVWICSHFLTLEGALNNEDEKCGINP